MSVEYFWKRVPVTALTGAAPKEIADLVPYWFDDDYDTQRDAGLVVGAEDTGALICALLGLGSSGTSWDQAARWLVSEPVDWDDDWMTGTIDADAVHLVAGFLAEAPVETWAREHHTALVAYAAELGYQRPFDEEWAEQVVAEVHELRALFGAAATAGEAVVLKIVA